MEHIPLLGGSEIRNTILKQWIWGILHDRRSKGSHSMAFSEAHMEPNSEQFCSYWKKHMDPLWTVKTESPGKLNRDVESNI